MLIQAQYILKAGTLEPNMPNGLLRGHALRSSTVSSRMLLALGIDSGNRQKAEQGVLVRDFFSPVNSSPTCLFSYLSLAVSLEAR